MIELACIADGAYVRHAAAMLQSACVSAPRSRFSVHVLHSVPINDEDGRKLRATLDAVSAELHLLHVPAQDVADLPEGYFPRSVWLRILLPELLPSVDKVLYLDADTVVVDDLTPLWETALAPDLVGAVTNPLYPFMPPYYRDALGIARPEDYFNSGVLLMDLDQMRREETATRLREYAIQHPGNWYPDQDAFNVVCQGRRRALHPRWNVQSTIYELKDAELPFPADRTAEARQHPAVVHFIGPFKPWSYLCRHPLQHLYFEHARATPWGAPAIEGRTWKNRALRRLPLVWIDRWMRAERRAHGIWHRTRGWLAERAPVA